MIKGYCKKITAGFLYYVLIFLCSQLLIAQNQHEADSLKHILAAGNLSPERQMDLFSKIALHSSSPDEVLLYADKLLSLSTKFDKPVYTVDAYHYKGVGYRLQGNLKKALENLFHSAALAAENKLYEPQAEAYSEVANIYSANNDLKNALLYNKKATSILRQRKKGSLELAINLLNTGYHYYLLKELDSALLLYDEAGPIIQKTKKEICNAYLIGNKALVYWKQGKYDIAEKDLLEAINLLNSLQDEFGETDYHNQLGNLYFERGQKAKAEQHALKGLSLAEKLELKEQIRDASYLLYKLNRDKNDFEKALEYQTLYVVYEDSIENSENTKQLANLRTEYEVSLKENEIVLLEKDQLLNRIYIIIAIFLLITAVLLNLYFRQRLKNTRLTVLNEQKRHDQEVKDLLTAQETKSLKTMIQGQEKERKRLAQELHNHFGSLMATIKVNLNAIDETSIPNYTNLTSLVDQACNDIRNISHTLNMGISQDFGLVPAIRELTDRLSRVNGLEAEFSASMGGESIGFDNEVVIYRVVQELISNVLKHAEASRLSIQLIYFEEDALVNILVQDNGKGFDVDKGSAGIGLKSLTDMVTNLHGDIKFDSNPASGTTVIIDLPVSY
ncbi:tetratricopeptide repeat protein [Flavobacterium sp. RHBU_3]|uniref:tetratricopeptide repeat-containing sensor histidine kinase n=1 Tax=Flavobacterium sp. RHBU_3 TaxID=3391184 RepID=UPI003984B6E6